MGLRLLALGCRPLRLGGRALASAVTCVSAMRRRPFRWLSLALCSVGVVAQAQGPILHEYIEPNPAEDVELSATTQDGAMPAALETESGVVPAPQSGEHQPKAE